LSSHPLGLGCGVLQDAVGLGDLALNCLDVLTDLIVGGAKLSA
jgi:hypothetical protein